MPKKWSNILKDLAVDSGARGEYHDEIFNRIDYVCNIHFFLKISTWFLDYLFLCYLLFELDFSQNSDTTFMNDYCLSFIV